MTYLRFVVHGRDTWSGRRQGLLHAMGELYDRGALHVYQDTHYARLAKWFDVHLRVPSSFSRSSRPHAKRVALSWFKQSAGAHIAKMREIAVILEDHGVCTEVLFCERPGYVVYDDEFQTVAEPYAETTT
jgi:hypothetical protein